MQPPSSPCALLPCKHSHLPQPAKASWNTFQKLEDAGFMSIRRSPGQAGEVSTELAPPSAGRDARKHQSKAQLLNRQLNRALDQEMRRQEHGKLLLGIGSTSLSPSCLQPTLPLPLRGFNCIKWSSLPDIQLHSCQQQLVLLTQSQKDYKRRPNPPTTDTSWTISILPKQSASQDQKEALPMPSVPGSMASYSHIPAGKISHAKN